MTINEEGATQMTTDIATMTYEDHVKAVAAAYDADCKAAVAEFEATQRRGVTSQTLQKARSDLRDFTRASIHEHVQVEPDEIAEAFVRGCNFGEF